MAGRCKRIFMVFAFLFSILFFSPSDKMIMYPLSRAKRVAAVEGEGGKEGCRGASRKQFTSNVSVSVYECVCILCMFLHFLLAAN